MTRALVVDDAGVLGAIRTWLHVEEMDAVLAESAQRGLSDGLPPVGLWHDTNLQAEGVKGRSGRSHQRDVWARDSSSASPA